MSIKRQVHGIFLLDKPVGITSNAALQTIKRLFSAKKAGHTGSLDPLASGMLPICFGEATKFSQYLLSADKTYWVTAKLGIRTTTSDAEGEIVSERVVPKLTQSKIEKFLDSFRGEIEQIPSMYSALKYQGQPLYKLARQGIEVPREVRRLTIYRLDLLNFGDDEITLEIHCSKGTYVRTLVDDLGELIGCGAHIISLRRLDVGAYSSSQMISLPQLEEQVKSADFAALDQYLLPIASACQHWPQLELTPSVEYYLRLGNSVFVPHAPTSGLVQLFNKKDEFLGMGEILENGKVAPKRLIVS